MYGDLEKNAGDTENRKEGATQAARRGWYHGRHKMFMMPLRMWGGHDTIRVMANSTHTGLNTPTFDRRMCFFFYSILHYEAVCNFPYWLFLMGKIIHLKISIGSQVEGKMTCMKHCKMNSVDLSQDFWQAENPCNNFFFLQKLLLIVQLSSPWQSKNIKSCLSSVSR